MATMNGVPHEEEDNLKVSVVPDPENDNASQADSRTLTRASSEATARESVMDEIQAGHPVASDTGHTTSYAAAVAKPPTSRSVNTAKPRINGSTYPALPDEASNISHEEEAWKAAGIRFAPLHVPAFRRVQTAAVLFHCTEIILVLSFFWFTIANPFTWPFLVPYLLHLSLSTIPTNGDLRYRSEFLRSLPLWKLFASYFPMKLHKTHDLPPDRKYILGYHPHGIISHGCWCAFATNALGWREKFPGITNSVLTLDSNFRLPFYRDWLLLLGLRSVSKESIWNLLSKGGPKNNGEGRAVTIVTGGARESLEAHPGTLRLILKDRKGFVKMALRTGADLVPVVAFGENDLYDQLDPDLHPAVHKLQMFVLKVFKFTLPALHGRGLLNYDVGLMPYRRPVNIVVGKPIRVEKSQTPQPQQEDIDRLHDAYIHEVEALWETYRDRFAPDRKDELEIIS